MELLSLSTCNFRNLVPAAVTWMTGTNFVLGGNGEGKTNVLEAVAVLGNLRSFRTHNLSRVVRHGETRFCLQAEVSSAVGRCRLEQVVEIGPPLRRSLSINGGTVDTAQYLSTFPVFAITPPDRELVVGRPELRRAFLDRFAFLLDPSLLDHLRVYRRALRQRNVILCVGASQASFEAWEERLAAAAAAVVERRLAASERLDRAFGESYGVLRGRGFPEISMCYRADSWLDLGGVDLAEQYQSRYAELRSRDQASGFTVDGPHRHDLSLRAAGQPVRDLLSAGQTRVVAAALRLGALGEVERERREHLPLVVDDIDSELDVFLLDGLMAYLGCERQLFLSSPHGEWFGRGVANSHRVWISAGSWRHERCEVAGESG